MRSREEFRQRGQVVPLTEAESPTVDGFQQSGGSLLEQSARGQMERWFDADFSRVRVHTDIGAQKSAEAMGAAAYTVGEDIFFGAGRYAPASGGGARLLAHELTHVVQQQGATPTGTLESVCPSDSSEAEAHHAAPASRLSRQAIQMSPATAQKDPIAAPSEASVEQYKNLLRGLRAQVRDVRDRRYSVVQPPELSPWESVLRVFRGLPPPYTKSVDPYLADVDLHLKKLNGRLDEIDRLLSEADKLDGVARKLRLSSAGRRMLGLSISSRVAMLEVEAIELALYAVRSGSAGGQYMQVMAHFMGAFDSLRMTEGSDAQPTLADFRQNAPKLQRVIEELKGWAAQLKVGADISRKVIAAADAAMIVLSLLEGAVAESPGPPSAGPPGAVMVTGQVVGSALSAEWVRAVLDLIASGALDPAVAGIASAASGGAPSPPPGTTMMAGPKTGGSAKGGSPGGVRVPYTKLQGEALSRLKDLLRRNGRWTDLSSGDRSILGTWFHQAVEALSEYIYRGVGAVHRGARLTGKVIAEEAKRGGRLLITEGWLNVKREWKRFDLVEIDFSRARVTVLDLTSLDDADHLAKTAGYRDALAKLTGFPADAIDMLYVGDDNQLLSDLLESVAP